MNFLFAWRYFKAKKSTNAINIISWISIVAIVIGTASLILVLSVFNGFEGLVKSLYASFYPELKITPVSGKQITLTPEQLHSLRAIKGVKAISLVVEEKALLQNRATDNDSADNQSVINLKGVDNEYTAVTGMAQHVVEGEYNVGDSENPLLVLGAGIQNAVDVQSERNVKPLIVYLPKKGASVAGNPMESFSSEAINTAGTFVIQQDFDDKYAITNLAFVKKMVGMAENAYSAAEIALFPHTNLAEVQQSMRQMLGPQYQVLNRYEQNASLYSVMSIEKWIIYAILSLILIVAAFNMVGALTMLVLEKQQDISVLHALGANQFFIQKVFLSEGMLLGFIGGGTGMLLAFIIGELQLHFHLIPLEGSTFMIDYFPVSLVPSDFLLVGCTVFVIALVASWLPSRKASLQHLTLRTE